MTTTAIIYSNPGCMKCKMTRNLFEKAGIPVETRMIKDHPKILATLIDTGELTLPYVQIIDQESSGSDLDSWHDFKSDRIKHWTKEPA